MNRFMLGLRIALFGLPEEAAPSTPSKIVGVPEVRTARHPSPAGGATPHGGGQREPFRASEDSGRRACESPEPGDARGVGAASIKTVQQLIALRDSVLLAADHTQPMSHKAVITLARRLGEILELEQVIAFEAEGQFDPMQQQVVDTLDSADPARDRCVALSVRPGYRRAGELLRRQGVVLFKFDEVRSSGPS